MNTHVKAVLWIIVVILILSPISEVAASESPDQSFETLTLIFLYDRDHDGSDEGVGAGTYVDVYRFDEYFATGVTNELSSVAFQLPLGTYEVIANAGLSDVPIYYWICTATVDFFNPGQVTIIRNCYEVGIHRLLLPLLGFK